MSLSENSSRTSFFQSSLEGGFMHFAEAKYEPTSHAMSDMEWSSIKSQLTVTEILDSLQKLNDVPLLQEGNMIDRIYSVTESPYSIIKHRESSVSDSFMRHRYLGRRVLLYEALKNTLNRFFSPVLATELTSFGEVTLALK